MCGLIVRSVVLLEGMDNFLLCYPRSYKLFSESYISCGFGCVSLLSLLVSLLS